MEHLWRLATAAVLTGLVVSTGALTAHAAETSAETTAVFAETTSTETTTAETSTSSQTTKSTTKQTTTKVTTETTAASTTKVTTTTKATTTAKQTTAVTTTTLAETTTTEPFTPGWEERGGKRYYRFEDGSFATGEQVIDDVPYLFGYSGAQKTDWQTVSGKRYYYDPATGEAVFGWLDYFGERYYISREDGKLTGSQELPDSYYTFEEDGSLLTGSYTVDGKAYYADPNTGKCCEGKQSILGQVFFTDKTGALLDGWQEADGMRYYISGETHFAEYGFFEVDGAYYVGTPQGLVYGEYWLDGDRLLFDTETGALHTGWFTLDGALRYFDVETMHVCYSEFDEIDGLTYYFNENGEAVTGLQTIGEALYFFDESGIMQTGLQTVGDKLYCFDEETGKAVIGAYATFDGVLRFGQDGAQVFGWETVGDARYYTDENGYVLEGWQTIGDYDYKFDAEGLMISDGRLYNQFDPKWKEVTFGSTSSSSMYSSACGIFSFCNAIFAMNRIEADAVEVATWAIGVKAFRPGGGGTYREILYNNIEAQYGEALNFTVDQQVWGKITDQRLISHLESGKVAVIHVAGHFMCVTGYNPETGLYHVLESAVSSKRGLAGDSWVDAAKMSSGNTNVDWFVLLSPRAG